MPVEYLLVTYPEDRAVLADGENVGSANHVLLLPADEYEITLAGEGYAPASQDIVLANTSEAKPMVVAFTPAAAVAPASSSENSAGQPSAAKKSDA
jgi:hypothetical protein